MDSAHAEFARGSPKHRFGGNQKNNGAIQKSVRHRKVHQELKKRDIACNEKLVEQLMHRHGLAAKRVKRYEKTTDSDHKNAISPNTLNRKFEDARPNAVWTGDIKYLRTKDGWLYLCVWIDLYSRKIVGWSVANHMRASFVCKALEGALRRLPGARPMIHSDRGVQYASDEFR